MDRALDMTKTGICEFIFAYPFLKYTKKTFFEGSLGLINFILKINLNKNYKKEVDLWKAKK